MKEILITVYLTVFKMIFNIFKLFPLKNKTVFLSTFGDNALFIAKELASSSSQPIVFINSKNCRQDFAAIPEERRSLYYINTIKISDHLRSIYHMATSKYIFVDTYVGALAAIRFKKGVKCVQLWHAPGAVKKFGWSDPETAKRSSRAKQRFQKVYDQFHFIVVGSQKMADIFSEAFHIGQDRFLFTGVPQTDFYFDEELKRAGLQRLYATYPRIRDKKIVLYAPTFRKESLHLMKLDFGIQQFLESLDDDYFLMIRLHPAVHKAITIPENPRILLVTDYPQLHDLLTACDILVTDYSSIPVEFSLLKKKMIFFTYDIEMYSRKQGLWSLDDLSFPGPVAISSDEVIRHIKDPSIDLEKIERFRNHWNAFSNGISAKNLIKEVYHPRDL